MLKFFQSNSHLFGGNALYIEDLYESYLDNPGSVPEQWRAYFDQMQLVAGPGMQAEARDVAHAPIVESFALRAKQGTLRPGATQSDLTAASRRGLQTASPARVSHSCSDTQSRCKRRSAPGCR